MNSFLDKMRSWIPAHAPEWVFKASMAVWEAYKNLTMPEQKSLLEIKTRTRLSSSSVCIPRQQAFWPTITMCWAI